MTQSLVDCILTVQSTGRAIYSRRSAGRKTRPPANSCGGKSCHLASPRHRQPRQHPIQLQILPSENQIIQSNRACVIVNCGGIILRRQTQPAENHVIHFDRATVIRGRVNLGEPVVPITPGGNIIRRQTRRKIKSFRTTALQSTAAEISYVCRKSRLVCVNTSVAYPFTRGNCQPGRIRSYHHNRVHFPYTLS